MEPKIAILGAGPSGLTLARLLEVKGIDYIVFERDSSPTAVGQGGTLDIRTDTGQLALKECGLFEQFKSLARYDGQAMLVVDRDMNVVWDKKAEGQTYMPEIDRKELRRMLLESLPSEKIQWGTRVDSVGRDSEERTTIRFDDGTVKGPFKLVVGADGAWSKGRSVLTSAKPLYSGLSYLNTTISTANPEYATLSKRAGLGSFMGISSGKSIIVQRMGDGYYNVYVGLRLPENWAKTNAKLLHSSSFRDHLVETEFEGWSSEITDFIKHSDGDWHSWPLYSLLPNSISWKPDPSCTLVGDAAHLGLPNGEGVNSAMQDSLELANEIEKHGLDHLDEAVKAYEEKMLPRGREHIEDGDNMAEMFYEPNAPQGFRKWLVSMGQVPLPAPGGVDAI